MVVGYGEGETYLGSDALALAPLTQKIAYLEEGDWVALTHDAFDACEAVVGEHMWNFADFQTVAGFARADGNKKGAFTRGRRPKAVAHELRRRWRSEG